MSNYIGLSDFRRPKQTCSKCSNAALDFARKVCDNLGLDLEDTMELAEEIQVLLDNCIEAIEEEHENSE